ncbi:MAG: hypothetical protein AB7K35_06590 [Pseudorhodoplanes sp.]
MAASIGVAVAVYALAGLVTALSFVTFGVHRVLPPGTGMSVPARILLLPGTVALWPYVLYRWCRTSPPR